LSVLLAFCVLTASGCGLRRPVAPPPAPEIEQRTPDALRSLADGAYKRKDYESAQKFYLELVQRFPGEAEYLFRLGNVYARTEQADLALRAYHGALERDPNFTKARYNLAVFELRQAARNMKRLRTGGLSASGIDATQVERLDHDLERILEGGNEP
jgi:tetratricopeptide (TPR) repeat protein